MNIIIVIETNYALPEDFRERYIGAPCHSFGEAEELVRMHACEIEEFASVQRYFVHNGERWYLSSTETGEILREYAIQYIDFQ